MRDLDLILSGFLSGNVPNETCDALVMGEVLEHVEEPYSLLERIIEIVMPDGFVFVSTCIIAPSQISSLISWMCRSRGPRYSRRGHKGADGEQ